MFGKRKVPEPAPGKRKGAGLMSQMGLGPIPGIEDIDSMVYGDDDDDDLEAELAALANEDHASVKKPRPKQKGNMGVVDIEKLAAVGMQDVDEDVSDTEDPDLLAELEELEDDEEEPLPSKSPQRTPIPSAFSPPKKAATVSPIFEPTLPSRVNPAPAPRNLPLPQKIPAPTPAPKPSPTPSPKPASSPLSSSSGGGGGGGGGGTVAVLEERLNLYKQASAIAKTAGDSSKQRRLDRGIKTLADLLKQAKTGKPINEEDIPPPVALGTSVAVAETPSSSANSTPAVTLAPMTPPKPSPQTALPSTSASNAVGTSATNATKQTLLTRRDQYRRAAFMAKQGGDIAKAGQFVRIAKQFDEVIQAVDEGKPVDLSKMPPAPAELPGESTKTLNIPQTSVSVQRVSNQAAADDLELDLPKTTAEEEKSIFNAPDAPKTVMEALTQRLEKYKSTESTAKAEGDSSKARRMGRIVKQYEDAIKLYKVGKPVDFDDLPTPPGFAPIPVNTAPPSSLNASSKSAVSSTEGVKPVPGAGASRPAPAAAPRPAPAAAPRPTAPAAAPRPAAPARSAPAAPHPGSSTSVPHQIQRQNTNRKSLHSRQEQQLAFLKERNEEFKQAAMNAKKSHDIELAKKYLRMMKGMEPMIEACESGLPVDLSQVPPSPLESEDADKFVVVSAEDCEPTGDRDEVYKTLQEDLVRQIRICVTNAQHYQKMGDVPAAAKFQKLEQNNRRDLDALKSAHRHGDPAPRFHYESRTFSMVQCNTDLGDTDLELTIIRGIQYNLPSGFSEKDMDTCVKYELGFPTEEPQTGSTGTVKDTVNPEYNETFKLQFNRKSKALFRFIERKGLKLDVIIKRGFFKGDKLLGTVNVKLQPLETKCVLHESFDLMEGRKSVGGKLEVKIRIRDPLKSKQVDEVKEKWLVIDQFIRTAGSKSQEESKAGKSHSDGPTCIEVLRFEKQMLDKQIAQLKDSLSLTQTQTLKHRSALIEEKIELQQKKLREGGLEAWKAYLALVKAETIAFEQEARQYAKLGDAHKFEVQMNKKKIADKAIQAIKMKIPDA